MADTITPNVVVSMPSQLFTLARSFKAAANGRIYIGKIDTDPTITENQIQVYLENEDGSHVPIAQPIIINSGGYPVYGGQIAKFVTVQGHSMAVYDAFGVQQFYFPNVLKYDPDQLMQRLAGFDGYKYIGRVPDYPTLRTIEPTADLQKIEVINRVSGNRWGGGVFNADFGDSTTPDDGGVVFVTAGGKRWKRQFEGDEIHLVWFKTPTNSWNDAWDRAIAYGSNTGSGTVRKIKLPAGDVGPMTKPVVFNPTLGWYVEGAGGNGQRGTNLLFNIPQSAGFADYGALHHFPPNFVEQFSLKNVNISGEATTAAQPGDENGFAYTHAVVCRAGNSTWFDVSMLNFRGSLMLDNSFDCAFYRVSTYAMGRMAPGFSYDDPAAVGNRDACESAPITIYSTRSGDASNNLRFYDSSSELQNVTPFIWVRSGIDIHIIRMHAERPGRSNMAPFLPMGSFARVDNAELFIDACGIQPNFINSIEFGNASQIVMSNMQRFPGNIIRNPSLAPGAGRLRIRASQVLMDNLTLPSSATQDIQFVDCAIGSVTAYSNSGIRSFVGCKMNSMTISGIASPLASDYGTQIIGGSISGNFSGDATAQRVTMIGTYVAGNVTYLGNNSRIQPSFVGGTETYNNAGTNHTISPNGPQVYFVNTDLTELIGSIVKGSQIYRKNAVSGESMGWLCTNTGPSGGGGTFARLPNLP
ncbi:TPA: phage tailspike protein [Serratia marcescens]